VALALTVVFVHVNVFETAAATEGVAVFCVTDTVAALVHEPTVTNKEYVPAKLTVGVAVFAPEEIPPDGPVQLYEPPPEPDNTALVFVQVRAAAEPAFAVGIAFTVIVFV